MFNMPLTLRKPDRDVSAIERIAPKMGFKKMHIAAWLFLCGILIAAMPAQALPDGLADAEPVHLTDGWQYQWGNLSSNEAGLPVQISEIMRREWKPLKKLGWPSDRKEHTNLWLRVRLPQEGDWKDPTLFISDSIQVFTIYQEGRPIYHFGDPNSPDREKVKGFRWHIVPLEPGYQGKELVFNIFSLGNFKGIMDQVVLGARADHIQKLILNDIDNVVAIALMMIISVFMFVLYFQNTAEKLYLTTGLYSFLVCFTHFAISPIRQFVIDDPTIWFRVLVLTIGFCWVVVGLTIELMFGPSTKKIFRRIWQIWLVFSIWISQFAIFLTYSSLYEFVYFFLAVITELVWISLIMQRVFKQDREAKILICGIVFSLMVELSFDFIILMGLSSNPPLLVHWGDIVLLTSISIVLALRYRGVYTQLKIYNVQLQQEITDHRKTELELQKYKRSLEDQVEERTRDLHQTNSQLIQEITEHKLSEEKRIELEKQLFQSLKMEAIGTLARGIAHDLNNSLGVMLGYTELLLDNQPGESEEKSSLEQVYLEGERAADLVQQILTFSRVYENELKLISIAPLLKESIKMMRTTLPPNIQINESFTAACPPILADTTQLHQVIMNLCTNASHAMKEKGGVLDISLEEVSAKAIQTPVPELMEGTMPIRLTQVYSCTNRCKSPCK
ncbi:hypothetical protein KKI24_18760 [bacterium]|nr:hypothetical protein [bacterium]